MCACSDSCSPTFLRFTANTNRFYELLEIDKGASAAEVKRAYKKQAVRHHPDKGGSPEHFHEISRAYEVLSDPVARAKYDEFGEAGLEPGCCEAPPEPTAEPNDDTGRLTVGACALATVGSLFCGVSTAAGVALCGIGRVLAGGGRHHLALAVTVLGGWLLLWPWVGLPSGVLWTAAMYSATLAGLGILAAQRDRLPSFLPYLLFAGYFLLFLSVPARSSERVLVELPGYVVIADSGEVESDCALAEGAALFTWGMVAVHETLTQTGSRGTRKRDEPSTV